MHVKPNTLNRGIWDYAQDRLDNTAQDFDNAIFNFKNEILARYKYELQMEYLQNLNKPGKMEPGALLVKL